MIDLTEQDGSHETGRVCLVLVSLVVVGEGGAGEKLTIEMVLISKAGTLVLLSCDADERAVEPREPGQLEQAVQLQN